MTMDQLIRENAGAFYVFDLAALNRRIQYLYAALPKGVRLCYAMKANPFLTGKVASQVERVEVCSPGEAYICRQVGVPPEKMVISGVYKTPEMMESLVKTPTFTGIFTIESSQQYALFCHLAKKYRRKLPVLLRLTNGSQFGLEQEELERILASAGPEIDLRGIQFFSGTQKTSLKKYKRELEMLDGLLLHLQDAYGLSLPELEFGPGFPVAYFQEEGLEEGELLANVSALLGQMNSRPQITLELGRSMAADCGRYFTHVVEQKQCKGQKYAIVDGGMHQLSYYGQHMAMRLPYYTVWGKEHLPPTDRWNVCGALCTMNDLLLKQAPLPPLAVGDVLCFANTGAYSVTEGIALFLSRDLPAVYLLQENGQAVCARKPTQTAPMNTPVSIE